MNYSLGSRFIKNGFDFYDHNMQTNEIDYLKTDIYEKEDAYYLNMEVPGINKDQLEISYENGYLSVVGKQQQEQEEVGEYIRKERYTSEMKRTFYVGDIDEEKIKAKYENGILKIRLEKKVEQAPIKKQIIIE